MFKPFTPDQRTIWQAGLLHTGWSCLLCLPPGTGKTHLSKEAILQVLQQGERAVYLAPTRALVSQQHRDFLRDERFQAYRIGIFDSDHQGAGTSIGDVQLAVMTPERLASSLRKPRSNPWLLELGLLVVDEVHTLGEGERGARLEGVILQAQTVNPLLRILALSGTLSNSDAIAAWLKAAHYKSDQRLVPVTWQVRTYQNPSDKVNLLYRQVVGIIEAGYQCLVFCQSRKQAELASQFLQSRDVKAEFHHAGRTTQERERVEEYFQLGALSVLCATGTLGTGLNYPAHDVILYDLTRYQGDRRYEPLPHQEVQQLAYRCGRPGFDAEGVVTLFAHTQEQQLAQQYLAADGGTMEPVLSQLSEPQHLLELIVSLVAGGYGTAIGPLERILSRSLAAHQGRLPNVGAVCEQAVTAGLLKLRQNGTQSFEVTPLGAVGVHRFFDAATLDLLVQTAQLEGATYLDLLLLLTRSADLPTLRLNVESISQAEQLMRREPSRILQDVFVSNIHKVMGGTRQSLCDRIYTALILKAWTHRGQMGALSHEFGVGEQDLLRILAAADRLLEGLVEVTEHEDSTQRRELGERAELLQRMLKQGMDEHTLSLTQIAGIGPTKARALRALGVIDLDDLAEMDPDLVVEGISQKALAKAIALALAAVKDPSAHRCRDVLPVKGDLTQAQAHTLKKALRLTATTTGEGTYRVNSSFSAYQVTPAHQGHACQCPHYQRQGYCQHLYRVLRALQDKETLWLYAQMDSPNRVSLQMLKVASFGGR